MTTVAQRLSTILIDQLDRMEADYYRNCDYTPMLEDEFELGIHEGMVSAIFRVKDGDLDLSGLIKSQEWESKKVIYKNNTDGYKTNLEAEERQLGIYRGVLIAQETITNILHDSESILRIKSLEGIW